MLITDKINSRKVLLLYVPKSLDFIFKLAKNKKIQYRGRTIKSHNLIAIVNHFLYQSAFYKKDNMKISSYIFKERYGAFYNFYINFLVEHNILQKEGNHLKNVTCRRYSINRKVLKEDRTRIKITDPVFIKNWKKRQLMFVDHHINILNNSKNKHVADTQHKSEYDDDNSESIKNKNTPSITSPLINPNILKMITEDLYFIKIDSDKAIDRVDNLYTHKEITIESYWKNVMSIENLKNGIMFHVLDKYGRFHTNFTNLKSVVRDNDITIDGEPIVGLDIKNSQPLHLTLILQETGFDVSHPIEYKRFEHHVKSGIIYEQLMGITNKSRKKCKTIIYKTFFGKTKLLGDKKYFAKLYPEIWRWLCEYKNSAGDHKILSHRLQKLESELIYGKIIPEIKSSYPDIRLFTVHDAIYIKETYKDKVSIIFNKHIEKTFNLKLK